MATTNDKNWTNGTNGNREKSGNFQADIHDTDYEAAYTRIPLRAAGLVNITGRETESLSGFWNFAADWYDTCRRASWPGAAVKDASGRPLPLDFDWEAWDRMPVPSCWNTEVEALKYFEGSGVYTRTFHYVKSKAGERLFLRFEGAAYRTSVFLNGVHIGTHDGASTPFSVEVSETVKEDNRLVVVCDARRSPARVPMDNTDWYNYGGLYRDLALVRLPPAFIKDWFVRLVPDGAYSNIAADVYVDSSPYLDNAGDGKQVRLEIPDLGVDCYAQVKVGKASFAFTAKPELWSPEAPRLYNVIFTLYGTDKEIKGANAPELDSAADSIGFREIAVRGKEIFLNGKKIFLKGVSVHEDHILLGKTTTEQVIRDTIRDLRDMNGNYLRLAHYPHDGRFARIADEEGVMLWEEVPVYWAIAFDYSPEQPGSHTAFERPSTYTDAENQLAELVLRDRNRASVIIWSVGNENADTDARLTFMSHLAAKARELDGTRPISAACLINHVKLKIEDRLAEHLDIIGVNEYYGWYDPDFSKLPRILENSHPEKPVIITEFGGGARAGHHGSADDIFTEEFQERLYQKQAATLKKCPFVAGTSPWILYDFRCPRRLNRYQEGWNRKGLIGADRRSHKKAFFVMAELYKEIGEIYDKP